MLGLSNTLYGVLLNRVVGQSESNLFEDQLTYTPVTAGFFYGITGATHSVVGELSDETNQSIAFPLYDVVSAVGYVIG